MQLFLRDTMRFFLFISAYFLANYFINQIIINSTKPDVSADILIVGDSHTKYSINPAVFISAKSIAQKVEPIYVSFWKLKNILKNSKVNTIVLGFSPHNLSKNQDAIFNSGWASIMFKRIYPIEEIGKLEGVPFDRKALYTRKFRNMCVIPRKNHIFYLGKYEEMDSITNHIYKFENNVRRHFFDTSQKVTGVSETGIKYLWEIVDFCKANNIKLVLVATPLHENYRLRIPDSINESFNELKKQLELQNVLVLDYSAAEYADSEFYDVDHLNSKGAKRFSLAFRDKLHLLNK